MATGWPLNVGHWTSALVALGDYCAGAGTGALTAVVLRFFNVPHTDMVVAMLIGTALGLGIHVLVSLVLGPVLGLSHVMIPAA